MAIVPAELVPSPQLICELVIVPELAVTVAVTLPPVVIVEELSAREVASGAITVTFATCI